MSAARVRGIRRDGTAYVAGVELADLASYVEDRKHKRDRSLRAELDGRQVGGIEGSLWWAEDVAGRVASALLDTTQQVSMICGCGRECAECVNDRDHVRFGGGCCCGQIGPEWDDPGIDAMLDLALIVNTGAFGNVFRR